MPITATVVPGEAGVRLDFTFVAVAGTSVSARVQRHLPDGTVQDVRGGNVYQMMSEVGVLYDYEAPLDLAGVFYTAVGYTNAEGTTGPTAVQTSNTVTVPSDGFIWFKDPTRPWADVPVDLCLAPSGPKSADCEAPPDPAIAMVEFGEETRAADTGLFPVLNRERPTDIWARRKDIETSITFASRTCEAIDTIYDLFTVGGPLFIQAQEVYCWPDRYVQPGDLNMSYVSRDQRKPWRLWQTPLVAIDQPAPQALPQGGVCTNWCAVEDTYSTFAALTATGFTWLQVYQGAATVGCTP